MRLRHLATATTLALVVSLTSATAAEAAPKKPTFKVTVKLSAAKADVGRTIKVSGKVAGPRAAKKRLAVQVKTGSGAWRTVKKVRTTKTRRYATTIKVTTAGQQSVRVVAPKSSRARAGKSTTRRFIGWRWLDLTTQKSADPGSGTLTTGPVRIAGRTYPKAWTLTQSTIPYLNPAGHCTAFKATAGVIDGNSGQGSFDSARWTSWSLGGEYVEINVDLAPGAAPKAVQFPLSGIAAFAMTTFSSVPVAVVAPQAYCSVNALPQPPADVFN